MTDPEAIPEVLLEQARAGDDAALGRLLELYRNYLRIVARSLIGPALRAQADPSDLVQEACLKAHREFDRFLGASEPELVAWLRQILVRSAADHAKYHRAKSRDHRRGESLDAMLDRSSLAAQQALAAPISTPSVRAARREQAVLLADALARLPEDYREVVILRNIEHVPFDEVAARMGRSPGAVRKLWTRAMLALRRELEER
jgi:RNA polymerase sigma-70 factor (ECF subfamily)